jgi:hypothetical protein
VAQGRAQVAVVHQGEPLTVTETDREGRFAVTGLKPGVYELHLAQGGGAYRVWAPRTAPPAAEQGVLLVQDSRVVRGLGGDVGKDGGKGGKGGLGGGYFGWLANPWVLGGLVAAAIAIPLALDDDDAS